MTHLTHVRESDRVLIGWCIAGQQGLVRYAGLMEPVWRSHDTGEKETDRALALIYNACLSTSDSALGLVQSRKVWDADILVRSVFEGTCKFVLLCSGDQDVRSNRIREYQEELPQIASVRDHTRLAQLLEQLPDPQAPVWLPLREMLLPAPELEILRARYPRSRRKDIEQRWSFNSIVAALSEQAGAFSGFSSLLHGYGMSSHVAHVDWTGASMIWERERRSPERVDTIEVAHGGRIIYDLLTASQVRVTAAYLYKGLSTVPIASVTESVKELRSAIDDADERWRTVEYLDSAPTGE